MKKYLFTTFVALITCFISNAENENSGLINEWGKMSTDWLTNKIYVTVSAGKNYSLALTTNGVIVGWGDNDDGQTDTPEGSNYLAISAGNRHAAAIRENGSIVAWGNNEEGATNAPPGNDFVNISSGIDFSLAIKNDGSIVGWGANGDGQTEVPEGYDFKNVAAGGSFGLALKIDGSLVIWGSENDPDLYDALTNMPSGNDFIDIDAGYDHCIAIRSDGTPVAWGRNDFGQTDIPVGTILYEVAAGAWHNIGIKLDGTLIGWGANSKGQTDCPQGNTFLKVGAGRQHSLAVNFSGLSAQILADKTIGLYTLPVQFLAGTSGTNANNIYYSWDFEDDGIIDIEGWGVNSPTNFYTNGIYSVRLSVSNEENDTAYNLKENYINVMNQGVDADFYANAITGVIPFSVQFNDLSANVPQYWSWDFDNNDSIDSTAPNPSYTYSSTGTFSVSLLVSNNFGAGSGSSFDSITKQNYIVAVPAISALFSVDKTKASTGETINFTDLSINGPNYWKWDFDNDGLIDTTNQNPSFAYSTSGYKTVTLICGNEFSVATNTQFNLITITTTNHSLYVWKSGGSVPPFDSWLTAATNIQDAINISLPGAEILISNGVYSSEGYSAEGTNVFSSKHKLKFTGCGNVTIDGKNIMRGCHVISGELYRIKFINGMSENNGGNIFADSSSFISCLIFDGAAVNGGGIFLTNNSKIYNCTVADNSASEIGGGAYSASQNEIWNSILYDNYAPNGSNYYFSGDVNLSYSCTLPQPLSGGTANVYESPDFTINYNISDVSPCINSGFTFSWLESQKDIAGSNRVNFGTVDIGAYETDVPEPLYLSFIIYYLLFIIYYRRK